MIGRVHQLKPVAAGQELFEFSGQPRKFETVEAVPFRWPSKSEDANAYIDGWKELAEQSLTDLRLSKNTMRCIASHTARRDGTCRMTDKAISSRAGRSLASTKRDIQRLKRLGFLIAEYEGGDGRQERIRVLKLSVPMRPRSSQRIPPSEVPKVVSTYPGYVEPLDIGGRRNG